MNRLLVAAVLGCVPLAAPGQVFRDITTFESLDTNGDQRVDKEEAREESRLHAQFSSYDLDGDGVITKREFQRYLGPRSPPRVLL